MSLPEGFKPSHLAVILAVGLGLGLGLGALVTETMDHRDALLIAGLLALVAVGAMYELWLRLRR